MRLVKPLLLLAADLAVAGFVMVAVGSHSPGPQVSSQPGWYAHPPETTDSAYSSELSITFDEDSDPGAVTLTGFGLVGLSVLLTVGIIGRWTFTGRRVASA